MALNFNTENSLAFDLQTVNGSSTSRGAQAFAFDERAKYLYALEEGAINRYNLADAPNVSAIDRSTINGAAIGHQGLAIEYLTEGIKLWCTSSTVGRAAVRFDYKNNGTIDTGEVYTLFPTTTFANNTSCTPTVSRDQKYLIAHGTRVTGTVSTVRVFDLAKLLAAGPGDRSADYLYEWTTTMVDANNPMQGTASDGDYVYLIAGGTGFTASVNKRLHVFTMDGQLVESNNDWTVGLADAQATPDGTRYEPEGLSMMLDATGKMFLYAGVLSGNPGARRFRIYRMNAFPPISNGLAFNKFYSVAYSLLNANGSSTVRAAQSFAFDERNNILYTSFESAINRYSLAQGNQLSALDMSLPNSPAVGHQGLAIEYLSNSIKLWTTSNVDRRAVTRFDYQKDVAISGGEEYRLFPNTTYRNSIQTTPNISLDNRYLIAQGQKADTDVTLIRVFDLAKMVAGGPGDYTTKYLYEFAVPGVSNAANPVQGIASCGSYVYVVAGGTGVDPLVNKRLHVYTIDGKFVEAEDNVIVGRDRAMSVPNYRAYEPEGLAMRLDASGRPYLYLGMMYAYPDRQYDIYRLNAYRQVTERNLGMVSSILDFSDRVSDTTDLPTNTMNDILLTKLDGEFDTRQICKRVSIVENDTELDLMKGATEDFGSIFNYWKRISRLGASFSDTANPSELQGWQYNSTTGKISSTINSATVIGFISPDKFDNYVFDAQVSAVNGDDDFIGLCIAHAVDPADGTTHILTAMRGMNGKAPLSIDKDYNGYDTSLYNIYRVLDGLTWANGVVADGTNGGNGANGSWTTAGIGTRIRVTRAGDIITVETSQPNSNVLYAPATRTFDLSKDPKLAIFRGPQSFGYVAQSQANATWDVTSRPSVSLPIIDVRTWTKYDKVGTNWVPTQSSKAAALNEGLMYPNWSHTNETLGKFYYMDNLNNLFRL